MRLPRLSFLFLLIVFHCASISIAIAQEVIVRDPAPDWNAPPALKQSPENSRAARSSTVLNLPFRDDFSQDSDMPDTSMWEYYSPGLRLPNLSTKKGFNPPTKGVVTFDGTTFFSDQYNATLLSGYADSLVSKAIDLSGFSPGQNVWLSFFLQPGGNGDKPEANDSFIVEAALPSGGYYRLLTLKGDSLDSQRFNPVLIQLDSSVFFHAGFRLKFLSWGSLNGELDQWHLDFVYLDVNRNAGDTLFTDVSVTSLQKPLIREYSALPWFMSSYLTSWDGFFVHTSKLNSGAASSSVTVSLINPEPLNNQALSGTLLNTVSNAYSGAQTLSDSCAAFSAQTFSAPAIIRAKAVSAGITGDVISSNNILLTDFNCDSLMGYDDGDANVAYGLNSARGFAQRFELPAGTPHDTLRAVWIRFVPSLFYNSTTGVSTSTEGKSFRLGIWNELSGLPDTLITIALAGMNIDYGIRMNDFVRYPLSGLTEVPSVFYAGILQNDQVPVAVGLDLNTDNQSRMFYQDGSLNWQISSFHGTLMIRPEFYSARVPQVSREPESASEHSLKVYPNPVNSDEISFELPMEIQELTRISVFDLSGKVVAEFGPSWNRGEGRIQLPENLVNGLYCIRLEASSAGNPRSFFAQFVLNRN